MLSWDQKLFHFINTDLSNPIFDWLMPLVTDLHKISLVQLFVLPLILLLWFKFKGKKMLPILLGLILSVAASDLVSYRILKPTFQRPRPPAVENEIQLRTHRYAGHSFPSNHAANNFAAASFLSYCYPASTPVFLAIASLIAFSRVYVGVHYPLDVLAGALLGTLFGLFFFKLLMLILNKGPKAWNFQAPKSPKE